MSRRRATPRAGVGDVELVGGTQLDLFGQVQAELDRRAESALIAAEVERRATVMPDGSPVVWVAPWHRDRRQEGPGRARPTLLALGQIEAGEFQLDLNHVRRRTVPGRGDAGRSRLPHAIRVST